MKKERTEKLVETMGKKGLGQTQDNLPRTQGDIFIEGLCEFVRAQLKEKGVPSVVFPIEEKEGGHRLSFVLGTESGDPVPYSSSEEPTATQISIEWFPRNGYFVAVRPYKDDSLLHKGHCVRRNSIRPLLKKVLETSISTDAESKKLGWRAINAVFYDKEFEHRVFSV